MINKHKKLENIILDDNGKDDRLRLLEKGMTKYGCSSFPYSHISYSSCTASTISLEAYIHLQEYYNRMNLYEEKVYIEAFQNIRDDIRNIIGLDDDVDICLGSSGTDLELIPYLFLPENSKVLNFIIAPNEVGSGTSLAATGKVFSNVHKKYKYQKGDILDGFDKFEINLINLEIRDKNSDPLSDSVILDNISAILKKEEYKNYYKIIHSVYHTKTGLIKPDPLTLVDTIQDDKLIFIVDACQFRLSMETINVLLKKGCIVFITGSKFFAGPTFSAAALIPPILRDKAAFNKKIPKGFNFLFGKELFPLRWSSIDKFNYGNNLGLLLRWRASIFEMQLFNSVARKRVINTMKIFYKCIETIKEEYGDIVIYNDIRETSKDYDKLMANSIISFGFIDTDVDYNVALDIYKQLMKINKLEKNFSYPIHLGQPVKIRKKADKWLGTLRIALSSKFFVNYSGKIESIQYNTIYEELKYIFDYILCIKEKNVNKK